MLKERLAAAHEVASRLERLEIAIDEAIRASADMTAALHSAQSRAKLSPTVGDTAFQNVGQAMTGMLAARTASVALHQELAVIRNRMGLRHRVSAIGDLEKLVPKSSLPNAGNDIMAAPEGSEQGKVA